MSSVRLRILAAAAAGLAGAALPLAASADEGVVPVRVNHSLTVVAGAFASVVRSSHRVSAGVRDNGLAANATYSEIWLVFNHPEFCTHPTSASKCDPGSPDANPAGPTGFSVIPGGTFTTDATGGARFSAVVGVGDHAVVGGGLTNPRGAEVALVWHTQSHSDPAHIFISDPVRDEGDRDSGGDD